MNDTRGLYDDLRDVQVKKVENYWLKTTGVSSMPAAGVTAEMRLGAGRWRRSAGSAAGVDGSVLRADHAQAEVGCVQLRYSLDFR
jgi:hypothetical protein